MDQQTSTNPVTERIRGIAGRHAFPAFVVGFDVRFDELDEMPIVWLVFKTTGGPGPDLESMRARGRTLHTLTSAVADAVGTEVEDWSPRILIDSAEHADVH